MSGLERVLRMASDEVGYLEKATNSDLDSKTANAGAANFTKYGRDMDKVTDWYNGKKQGFEWCAVFYDWLFVAAFGPDVARKMLYRPKKSLSAGCRYAAEYFKAVGAFTPLPQPGDQIFFSGTQGGWSHTGLVTEVDGSYVHTIEGNTGGGSTVVANGGGVCKKRYARNYERILGYGHPDFSLVQEEEREVTRQEVQALIAQALYGLRGEDSAPSEWAKPELAAAVAHGITDGTRPQGYATREEVAAMVNRALLRNG